ADVSHPDSTPHTGTTLASPASQTQMATAGCCRNVATAMRDVLWKTHRAESSRHPRGGRDGTLRSAPLTIKRKGVPMRAVAYRKVDVDGIGVFYREAGPKDAPTILLLHGFPTAGHMFRDLIPQLADRFRLVAPDLLGF